MNLPFYKFQPDRWEFGDISVEPFDIQGLFLNVCNYYWKKITDDNPKRVALTTLKARYNRATDAMFDRLFEIGVLKDDNGFVVINFLDEQLEEISEQKEILSNAGKAGANKRWAKNRVAITTPMQSQSDSNSNKDKDKDKDKIKNNTEKAEISDKISSDHKKFIEIYFEWYEKQVGVKPKFTAADGKAIKSILTYLNQVANKDPAEAWKYLLDNVGKWEKFYQGQKKVTQIESNLTNIIDNIKNGAKNGKSNEIADRREHNFKLAAEVGREMAAEREAKERNNN